MIKVVVDDFIFSYLMNLGDRACTNSFIVHLRIGDVLTRIRNTYCWISGEFIVFKRIDDDHNFDAFLKEFYPEIFL